MSIIFQFDQASPGASMASHPQLVSNIGIAVLPDFLVVMDAGMRPFASRLLRDMVEKQFQRPVKYLWLTHYHADHVFGLSTFKDTLIFGAEQVVTNLNASPDWSPESMENWKKDDPSAGDWLQEVEFILPDFTFHQGLTIRNAGVEMEFRYSGGHTSCSSYGYLPAEKVLFAGDLLFAGKFPYAHVSNNDPELWINTLQTWMSMDISRVIPGHGPLADKEEIWKCLGFFLALKENTLRCIEKGGQPGQIEVPSVYPLEERSAFLMENARKRWYEYYLARKVD
jgi:glyoxylase-like metal-dependent hydrolase (beta-lactamase superfamily II)